MKGVWRRVRKESRITFSVFIIPKGSNRIFRFPRKRIVKSKVNSCLTASKLIKYARERLMEISFLIKKKGKKNFSRLLLLFSRSNDNPAFVASPLSCRVRNTKICLRHRCGGFTRSKVSDYVRNASGIIFYKLQDYLTWKLCFLI